MYSILYAIKKKTFVYGAKLFYLWFVWDQTKPSICSYLFCPPFAHRRTDSGEHVAP